MPLGKKNPKVDQNLDDVIRDFSEKRPDYQQLCSEVAYILDKRLKDAGIPISAISQRAKDLESFLKKINLKGYKDPIRDNEDFAGVRIVHLFKDDYDRIRKIITRDFSVIREINKIDPKHPKEFGYGANHFIVRLRGNLRGPRYDHLKSLKCEIQVRTVVQDAWAIVEYHLNYKGKRIATPEGQRILSSLSALFELSDRQFQELRDSGLFDATTNPIRILTSDLNYNSLRSFLMWKFNGLPTTNNESTLELIFQLLEDKKGVYSAIGDLNDLIDATQEVRKKLIFGSRTASIELLAALGIKEKEILDNPSFPATLRVALRMIAR